MTKQGEARSDIPRYAVGKSKRAMEMSKRPLTCGKCGKTFRRNIDLIHHQSGRRECQMWREANLGRQLDAANERIVALLDLLRSKFPQAPVAGSGIIVLIKYWKQRAEQAERALAALGEDPKEPSPAPAS